MSCGTSNDTPQAESDPSSLVDRIKRLGMRAGIAVNPGTEIEAVFPFAEKLDMCLVMTVEPGFGGQSFMPAMLTKVKTLRARYPKLDIQVDGGISPATIDEAASAGANVVVAGSAVFGSDDPARTILELRTSLSSKRL